VLYTSVMTIFGLQAMKRWGLDKHDRFQIWRYTSLISFQWLFFFLIPEFLFRWAVQYQWVGARLAHDPAFAGQAWRSYGLLYAWPLFFYTFIGDPSKVWVVWGAVLSFVLIPILVLFHGKRYCSWICGCGGLAETLGDRWRHLAPKGRTSVRWEFMNSIVLAAAVVVTILVLARDSFHIFASPALTGQEYYHLFADVWLVGILPVTLYPFFGGKVWCRYWCPLAKMMQIFSAAFTRFRVSRFAIQANEKCIACMECTRNCQVGIDVMQYALKQEPITNANSSCIGCGICVTVCPMEVLSFSRQSAPEAELVHIKVG
jgi:NosR/NirI family transcriptional regulator, nitrous oxide reductase regulator